ncbi:MAG: hypothetical protein GC204_10570 [Chloroflexi bacterium]|nr:hypothetical protein [Chloroflexota bacterium]
MRYVIAVVGILLVGVLLLNQWRPYGTVDATATLTATPLPDNFTLIPTFVPTFPCDLQNIEVHDDNLCRNESVSERSLFSSDGVLFIEHEYRMGQGCWGSVSQQIRELRLCTRSSGAITTLSKDFVTDLIASPDGKWLAFGTMNPLATDGDSLRPHLYRVRSDGSDLQPLDTKGFDAYRVGAPIDLRWDGANWLAFTLWDSSEGGYYAYRLKADGSGTYAQGGRVTLPATPTYPPTPTTALMTSGAPVTGTPPPPQPTGTLLPT